MLALLSECSRPHAEIGAVLDCALDRSLALMGARFGNVQLMDWRSGVLKITAQRGFQSEFLDFFKFVELKDTCACARALRDRGSIIIEDVTADQQFAPFRDIVCRAGVRAVQSTPLISDSGALVGILSTHFPMPHRPTDAQMGRMKEAAHLVANTIIRLRARHAGPNILENSLALLERSREALVTAEDVLCRGRRNGTLSGSK